VWTAGNLRYRITKTLSAGAEETGDLGKIGGLEGTGDLGKKEGDLLQGARHSTLGSRSLKSAYRKFPIRQTLSSGYELILCWSPYPKYLLSNNPLHLSLNPFLDQ
jgi:hypothetical protein